MTLERQQRLDQQGVFWRYSDEWFRFLTEFRQTLQVKIHLEMPRIPVQLGHIQRS